MPLVRKRRKTAAVLEMMPKTSWEYVSSPLHTVVLIRGHRADIFRDTKISPPVFHCLVQRIGSAEILFWEQTRTFEEAENDMFEYLESEDGLKRQHALALLGTYERSA